MSPWIQAARPKTLVAGFVPVLLGSMVARLSGKFSWSILFAALFGALAIQIGTNYVNDAADFQKGADREDRLGPPRMAALGLLSARSLYIGAGLFLFLAFVAGIYLTFHAGWPILLVGLFSLLFAVGYTAGPFPLAYLGLGDFFVFLFFGLVAVNGTYFSHVGSLNFLSIFISVLVGFHATALIAINNTRDIPTDTLANKKTLSLRMGDFSSRLYYGALVFAPFILLLVLAADSILWLIPFLSFPFAVVLFRKVLGIVDRREFNSILGKTAALQIIFSLLLLLSMSLLL